MQDLLNIDEVQGLGCSANGILPHPMYFINAHVVSV
jgi:hypothetical protein